MDSESVVSSVQRRIELQSPEDLAYLVANVRAAAAQHVNEAFPPHVDCRSGTDELRERVEALLNEYVDRIFTLAAPNLSINGLPVEPSAFLAAAGSPGSGRGTSATEDPPYEPFDGRKRRRVADLVTQEEKLLEEVAALKRSVPARVAAESAARLDCALANDQEALDGARAEWRADVAQGMLHWAVDVLPRQDGVEGRWRGAVSGLGRLKREMPAVVAKMERARVAGEYVVTSGR